MFVDSNVYANGILVQSKFLTDVIQKLNDEGAQNVLNNLENLRSALTNPSNLVLYIAGSLEYIADVTTPLSRLFLADQVPSSKKQ